MGDSALTGGFADPARDAARAFRAIMTAMAMPGRIERISGGHGPAPLSVAAATVLLTLCDRETALHLGPSHDNAEVRAWVAFHLGSPLVARSDATFALGTWEAIGPFDGYPVGTPEYPDRSTTLIVERDTLFRDGATLTGPGIRDTAQLALPDPAAFIANARRFPLGNDCVLTANDEIAAIPRTTCIAEEAA